MKFWASWEDFREFIVLWLSYSFMVASISSSSSWPIWLRSGSWFFSLGRVDACWISMKCLMGSYSSSATCRSWFLLWLTCFVPFGSILIEYSLVISLYLSTLLSRYVLSVSSRVVIPSYSKRFKLLIKILALLSNLFKGSSFALIAVCIRPYSASFSNFRFCKAMCWSLSSYNWFLRTSSPSAEAGVIDPFWLGRIGHISSWT